MRPSVLLSAAVLLCACAKTSDQKQATTADSALTADSASGTRGSASTKKKVAGKKAAGESSREPASSETASFAQTSAVPASPARGPVDTRCGVRGNPVLTDLGIGNVAIGRTVTTIKQTCRVVRDIEELTSEGTVDRVLTVIIGGDAYRVTVGNGLVWRIWVRSPRVATRDGLRVGTSLSRVAAEKGVKISEGEDGVYLLPESHCGLSFRFSVQSRWPTGRPWTMAELVRRHGGEPADRILVTRCVRPR
jgi:hypothetical protein